MAFSFAIEGLRQERVLDRAVLFNVKRMLEQPRQVFSDSAEGWIL